MKTNQSKDSPHPTLTNAEYAAVRDLRRLALRWPESLWVFVANGTFNVMKTGPTGGSMMTASGGFDPEYVVATIEIPADGGDW